MNILGHQLLQLLKFSGKLIRHRSRDESAWLNYLTLGAAKNRTVLDIGLPSEDDLLVTKALAGASGRVIAFCPDRQVYNQLYLVKSIFKWHNVHLERLQSTGHIIAAAPPHAAATSGRGAIVIPMECSAEREARPLETLDLYCRNHDVTPDVVRIYLCRKEWIRMLKGASGVLRTCKPKLIIVGEEKLVKREGLTEVFSYLAGLGYTGYFMLDALRIPVANFDFDTFQNPNANFYCRHFIFE